MPRLNIGILIAALVCGLLCSGVSMHDRILIETKHNIERQALYPLPTKEFFEEAMHGMFDLLFDEKNHDFSQYIPYAEQADYEAELENRFEGIGIVFRENPITEAVEVVYPLLGSPAFRAGIHAGDVIVAVGEKKTKEIPFDQVSTLIKGPLNTDVVLSILHRDAREPVDIAVKRSPIRRDSVEGIGVDKSGKRIFTLPNEPDIGYLRITSFSDLTPDEAEAALHAMLNNKRLGPKGLILDLRGNPGGFVSSCVEIANFFVEPNGEYDVIVSTRYRNGNIKGRYKAFKDVKFVDLPMVVLIDGQSASAAEILAACLQDYGRATLVGTRSFGKGTVQEIFDLPLRSGKYQLTDASYWRPSGRNINRDKNAGESDEWGVSPDDGCSVPLSKEQRYAQEQIRDRRSNIAADDVEAVLNDFVGQLPEEIERQLSEQKNGSDDKTSAENMKTPPSKPFVLEGTSPFYDPQLDKAISVLRRIIKDS